MLPGPFGSLLDLQEPIPLVQSHRSIIVDKQQELDLVCRRMFLGSAATATVLIVDVRTSMRIPRPQQYLHSRRPDPTHRQTPLRSGYKLRCDLDPRVVLARIDQHAPDAGALLDHSLSR